MIISATNALTMTPARATAVFKNRKPGIHQHDKSREILPPWVVVLLGGLPAVWLLDGRAGALVGEGGNVAPRWAVRAALFVTGGAGECSASGRVDRVLGQLFRGFAHTLRRRSAAEPAVREVAENHILAAETRA